MSKVLIIEDNPDNMLLISDILQAEGYETIQAEAGIQGFEMAVSLLPSFVILDIQLPDIDGYEVLDKLRANEITKNIPVIAMTSYAMAGDRERLLNAGCDGYVEKPIDPGIVMSQIKEAVGVSECCHAGDFYGCIRHLFPGFPVLYHADEAASDKGVQRLR